MGISTTIEKNRLHATGTTIYDHLTPTALSFLERRPNTGEPVSSLLTVSFHLSLRAWIPLPFPFSPSVLSSPQVSPLEQYSVSMDRARSNYALSELYGVLA